MGCDIHAYVERRDGSGNWEYDAACPMFDGRNYSLFGWLADVRNYSKVPSIVAGRGLPADVSDAVREDYDEWGCDAHSASWVSADELARFDYEVTFEDLRTTVGGNGGHTADPGGGEVVTYRQFLGAWYFAELDTLKRLAEGGPTRVVFWFDN